MSVSGYLAGLTHFDPSESDDTAESLTWQIIFTLAVAAPCIVSFFMLHWSFNGWEGHPIGQTLTHFCGQNHAWTQVNDVAADINREFRRSVFADLFDLSHFF